jgi:hypothetical protein
MMMLFDSDESVTEVAVTVTALPVGTVAGAVKVIAVPLVVLVAPREPQSLDPHDRDQLMLPPPTV